MSAVASGVRLRDALFFHALGKTELFEGLDLQSTGFATCVDVPIKVHERGLED